MRHERQPKQTPTFQRTLERAARQMEASGRSSLDVGNVLAAFYLEPASQAVYLLQKQGVTRLDVLRLRVARRRQGQPDGEAVGAGHEGLRRRRGRRPGRQKNPLEAFATDLVSARHGRESSIR